MSSLFQTKTVDQLLAVAGPPGSGLKRTQTTFDLVMLRSTILDDDETYLAPDWDSPLLRLRAQALESECGTREG